MTVFEVDQDPYHVPTVAKEVYDVTGAGTRWWDMSLALGTGPVLRRRQGWRTMPLGLWLGKLERQPSTVMN